MTRDLHLTGEMRREVFLYGAEVFCLAVEERFDLARGLGGVAIDVGEPSALDEAGVLLGGPEDRRRRPGRRPP